MSDPYPEAGPPIRVPRRSAHLETLRPYDLLAVALASTVGALLAVPAPDSTTGLSRVLLATVTGTAGCVSTLYAADYLTRHDDVIGKPHRPIPSGRLTEAAAKRSALLAGVVTVAVTCAVNRLALIFLAVAVLAQYAYGHRGKDHGLWGDLLNGVSGWSCTVLAGACFTARWPPSDVWPVAVVLGLQGTFSNLLLALGDLDADRAAGRRTHPVRHGHARTVATLALVATAGYTLAAVCLATRHTAPATYAPAAVALVLAAICLVLVAPRTPGVAARLSRATEVHFYERLVLPGALLAPATGTPPALAVTCAAVGLLALSPRALLPH
ncbi:UbiA family prenyltransferase [Streptomyces sp.]|uniref:UbiA family prenyltransferase n=1 Tax=Streptomyces sp. TaxID=1931 RepID=UPI002F4079B2